MMDEKVAQKVKISCENIRKVFIQKGCQEVHVLEDITLDVYENEFLDRKSVV